MILPITKLRIHAEIGVEIVNDSYALMVSHIVIRETLLSQHSNRNKSIRYLLLEARPKEIKVNPVR